MMLCLNNLQSKYIIVSAILNVLRLNPSSITKAALDEKRQKRNSGEKRGRVFNRRNC